MMNIEEIRQNFLRKFCLSAVLAAFAVGVGLLVSAVEIHNTLIIVCAGLYYGALYILHRKISWIDKNLGQLVVYGVFPFIFYALTDDALVFMTPSFLFFFPVLAFFVLNNKSGLYAVSIYILGLIVTYSYAELALKPLYEKQQVFFSVIGVIFTSFIGYLVSRARDNAENLYSDESARYKNYKLAINQATNHMILTDTNGQIVFANEAAEKTTGYSFAEMKGNTPRLWGGLETPDFYKKLWQTIKFDKKKFTGTIRNRRKTGEIYTAIAHIAPILDENNTLVGFIGAEEDITKLVELEEQVAQTNKRNEALLLSLGEGVVAQDSNNQVMFVTRIIGYSTTVLGLCLTSIATSLPELLTTLFSQNNKDEKLTMGNILGSNIYNITLIGGVAYLFTTDVVLEYSNWVWFAATATILFFMIHLLKGKYIPKLIGILLFGTYIAYLLTVVTK